MSNYEDAIGRAQAMIDDAVRIGGTALSLKEMPEFLTKLTYAQLEVADRLRVAEFQAQEAAEAAYRERRSKQAVEPQSEVEVEGTDVSAELLVAALADGSFRSAVLHELKRPYAPQEAQADGVVELVRGVLMGETPPVAKRAASEGESGRAYTCGLINDDGVMCSYPLHHRDWTNPASHSWNQEKPKSRDSEQRVTLVTAGFPNVDLGRSRDSDPVPWPKGYETEQCGVLNDEGDDCTFPKGHPSTHSWTWGD